MHDQLSEKAAAAPDLMKVIMDAVQRDLPQTFPASSRAKFTELGTIAGCVGLAIRLHSDVDQDHRTPSELTMRSTLAARYPESEHLYEDCSQFVRAGLLEMSRTGRGEVVFPLIAMWVARRVFGPDGPSQHSTLIEKLAQLYQRESDGYWQPSDDESSSDSGTPAKPNQTGKNVAGAALGSIGCLGIMGVNAALSVIPIVIALFIWLWLMKSCSSSP